MLLLTYDPNVKQTPDYELSAILSYDKQTDQVKIPFGVTISLVSPYGNNPSMMEFQRKIWESLLIPVVDVIPSVEVV